MKEKEVLNIPLRQKNILKMLLSEDGWIKGSRIAKEMGITDRTVRSDIAAINSAMEGSSNIIESSRQNGYRLKSSDSELLNKLLFNKKNLPITPEERLRYLSIRLMQVDESNPKKLWELADELAISMPTLESTIQKIRGVLENRKDPFVIQRKQGFIWTKGHEESRRFLLKELILDRMDPSYLMISNYYNYFDKHILETIMGCIMTSLKEFGSIMTDEDIIHLVVYLAIKHNRISTGHSLIMQKSETYSINDPKSKLAFKIADNMKDKLGLHLNDAEILDLIIQLSLMRVVTENKKDKEINNGSDKNHFMAIVDSLLNDIKDNFGLDLSNDEELRVGLCSHIKYMIKQKSELQSSSNPILGLLKTEYSFVFEMSLYLYECFYDMFDVKLNEDELGYITAYLGAAIERMESNMSHNSICIALVSNTNHGTSTLLMARIKSKFSDKFNLVGPYSAYSLDEIMKDNPSGIITTASKYMFDDCHLPVVKISPMLDSNDITAINSMVASIKNKTLSNPLPYGLDSYFDKKFFFKNLKADDYEEAITKMTEALEREGYVKSDFLDKTLEREKISFTTFGNLLVMPHPLESCSNQTIISVGILEHPIKWGNVFVQVIFLMSIRKEDLKYIRHLFNITVELANNPERVTRLILSKDYEHYISILREI